MSRRHAQIAMETERNEPEAVARFAVMKGAESAREANVGTAQEACESLKDRLAGTNEISCRHLQSGRHLRRPRTGGEFQFVIQGTSLGSPV